MCSFNRLFKVEYLEFRSFGKGFLNGLPGKDRIGFFGKLMAYTKLAY